MNILHYPAPFAGQDRILLIMLPGAGIEASAFAEHGMVAAVQETGLALDITVAQPDMALYLETGPAAALHSAIVEPALAAGTARIWLLGISLGGMGALLYASAYPAHVAGVVLLAPFLGTKGTIAEVAKAGSLAAWSPLGSLATPLEQSNLLYLQTRPNLYLGYGEADRFAAGHRFLAATLPADRVVTNAGGHDWGAWRGLWKKLVSKDFFL